MIPVFEIFQKLKKKTKKKQILNQKIKAGSLPQKQKKNISQNKKNP